MWIILIFLVVIGIFFLLKYIQIWKGIHSKTMKWEIVKSKSEKCMADALYMLWIQYEYERPLIINWKVVANPDFYLPKFGIWLEFWWLLNDKEYVSKMEYKKTKYKEYWIKRIDVYGKDIRNKEKKYLDIEMTKQFLINKLKNIKK